MLLLFLLELLAVYWPSPETDQLLADTRGLSCFAIFLSNFVSNVERHVCVNYSKWYKRCWIVLAGQAVPFLVGCLIFLFGRQFVAAFPQSSQMRHFMYLKIDNNSILVTFAVCIAAQMFLWIISRCNHGPKKAGDNRALTQINHENLKYGNSAKGLDENRR